MSASLLGLSPGDRADVRRVVAAIERDLSCLARAASPEQHRTSIDGLMASWASLEALLALGTTPITVS
jgi:hypothetical protein